MAIKKFLLISLTLIFVTSLVIAQEVGTFVGTVQDTEGSPLPGVTVTAKNIQTGLTQSTITNNRGRFRLERLPRGIYNLTASLTGFKTLTKERIELHSGDELRVDFVLEIGGIEEEVTVVGEAPLVETTRAQVSTVITEKEMLSYPQGNRNYLNLIQYAPGTLPGAGRSGFAINGMRGSANNFMIDGITNNDEGLQGAGVTQLPLESIQEFRLVSSNFSAEYGRNAGGIINAVMKSGTNEFHGSGWVFYRGDSPLFRTEDWLTHDRPPYDRWQYGGTLGGPIVKDKTFFFLTFEGTRLVQESRAPTYFFTQEAVARAQGFAREVFDLLGSNYPVPTYNFKDLDGDGVNDIGQYIWDGTTRQNVYNFGLKIDHIFSERDRIAFRWLHNYYKNVFSSAAIPGYTKNVPYVYNTGGLTWLHLFSPTMYNEVRLGYHSDHREWPRILPELPTIGLPSVASIGDATNMPQDFKNQTFQLVDILNFQLGDHSIKLGGEVRLWMSDSVFDALVYGYYSYFDPLDFLYDRGPGLLIVGADPPDPSPDNPYVPGPADGEWSRGNTHRKWRGLEGGLFFQDDWRVSDRLTLSFGLRWEYFGVPEETSGVGINMPAFGTKKGFETKQLIEGEYNREGIRYMIFDGRELMGKGLWDPYYYCFAPKFNFAYDLTGDGKTSLRGGAGISYDRTFNNTYENDRFNYPDFTFVTLLGHYYGLPKINPTIPVSIPQENILNYRVALRWMEKTLKPQQAINWMIGLQRELAPNVAIEINYTGSRGRRLGVIQKPNRFTGDMLDGRLDGINPYGAPNDVNVREQHYQSTYHALTVRITKRFSHGWSWYSAYTFGQARDQNSDYFGDNTGYYAVCHERQEDEWGPAQYDRRHRLVGGFVWDLPFFKNSTNWFVKNILAGWQLSGNFHYTSGRPFTVQASSSALYWDFNKDGLGKDRPLWLGNDPQEIIKWSHGFPYLDNSYFGIPNPPAGPDDLSYYNQNFATRNMFYWFPTHNINLSLQKYFTFNVGEREVTLQLIGEVFNVLKSYFWALPNVSFHSASFGEVSRMNGVREAQFSIRVMF
ncbi:MAG: TonB-dependent receptor [Candidatus Aminicenantes bacterium]|nr:TonB-dependent receptor [Candidatus Aminicenantes bacterium]